MGPPVRNRPRISEPRGIHQQRWLLKQQRSLKQQRPLRLKPPGESRYENATRCWLDAGVIVCPEVTIDEGAVIGAGSVVTRVAPAGELTVAPAKARSIPGWLRPRKT